jgi:signal transduction histidine kinase
MAAYEQRLDQQCGPLVASPATRRQVLANAEESLDEVGESLRRGVPVISAGDRPGALARDIGCSRAAHGVHPVESLVAANELFKILLAAVVSCLQLDEESTLTLGVVASYESIAMRIRESATSYTGFLLDKVYRAQVDERRHLARELHDRVSAGISIAHRQLDLYEIRRERDGAAADGRVEAAQHALVQAMNDIRNLTSELRLTEPVESLEKELRSFLESAAPEDVGATVTVNGDEAWAAPEVRDEVFLVVREALRNAFKHGHAKTVLVRIDIAPHELLGMVDDNGVGFEPGATGPKIETSASFTAAAGTGVPAMKERVALLGGVLRLRSGVGKGTRVELHIPLPEAQDAARS